VSMPEIGRLVGDSSDIELGFLDKEATPQPAMKLGIRLSLADTVAVLYTRTRTRYHECSLIALEKSCCPGITDRRGTRFVSGCKAYLALRSLI